MNAKQENNINKTLANTANNNLQPLEESTDPFKVFFESHKKDFQMVMPSSIKPERMLRLAISAIRRNPELMACDKMTVIGGVLEASSLGLEINTPLQQAYLVPFRNNKTKQKEAQLIIGYRGYIDLFYNHPKVISVFANSVCDNDKFSYKYGTDEHLEHTQFEGGERGEVTHFYAYVKLKNDAFRFLVLSIYDVNKIRDEYSQSYKEGGSDPWSKHYEAMGKKTVLRQLEKFIPKASESGLDRAMQNDFTSIDPLNTDNFVGEQPQ